ncbi:MAG: hypothetical protein ABJF23_13055 [Bryobacteraceae bacterium]
MGRFTDNAANIFEAAETAARSGHELSNMTILIGQEGGLHLIAESDWPLDTLQAHHGAQMAYRVRQREQTVRLEGREGSRTCLLEFEKLNGAARRLLAAHTPYQLVDGPTVQRLSWQNLPGASD